MVTRRELFAGIVMVVSLGIVGCSSDGPISGPPLQYSVPPARTKTVPDIAIKDDNTFSAGGQELKIRRNGSHMLLVHRMDNKIAFVAYSVDSKTFFITTINKHGRPESKLFRDGKVYRFKGAHPNPGKRPMSAGSVVPSDVPIALDGVVYTDCTADCEWYDYMTEAEFVDWYEGQYAEMSADIGVWETDLMEACCNDFRQHVNYVLQELAVASAAATDVCWLGNLLTWRGRASCTLALIAYFYVVNDYWDAKLAYEDCLNSCRSMGFLKAEPFDVESIIPLGRRQV